MHTLSRNKLTRDHEPRGASRQQCIKHNSDTADNDVHHRSKFTASEGHMHTNICILTTFKDPSTCRMAQHKARKHIDWCNTNTQFGATLLLTHQATQTCIGRTLLSTENRQGSLQDLGFFCTKERCYQLWTSYDSQVSWSLHWNNLLLAIRSDIRCSPGQCAQLQQPKTRGIFHILLSFHQSVKETKKLNNSIP